MAEQKATQTQKRRNEFIGEVVSTKMEKTIAVEVYQMIRHKKYGKFIRKSNVFKAHDEKNEAQMGDKVRIFETRPLSKTKRWRLAEIIERKALPDEVDA